ncbi:hypothetical protein C1646_755514 [Rhizophagus diaphanus]|nr:hypothetical protein C1646_755514 [Rhizophagus diaphanus] [Rhizophagus sp. MUCL 43196]
MALNTRSKVSKTNKQIDLNKNHPNLTDKEIIAETYGVDEDGAPEHINTKRKKIDTSLPETPLPSQNIDKMDIDNKENNEHPISSEIDLTSRDTQNDNHQTPINELNNKMNTDQHDYDTNGDNSAGSSDTHTPHLEVSNNSAKQTIIFKENDLRYDKCFTILIATETTFNKLKNQLIALLNNITPNIFSKKAIDDIINNKLTDLQERSIKLANVPINYDIDLLIKHIANYIKSAIASHKEIIPNRSRYNNNQFNRKRSDIPSIIYKTVIITFEKKSAADYLMNQSKWGILIETFVIRILPFNEESNEYKKCLTPSYVVTGIPLNTYAMDMMPLLDYLQGRSIEILPTKPISLHKIAYIYTDISENDSVKKFSKFDTAFKGFKLFIFPSDDFIYNTRICDLLGDFVPQI